MTFRVLYYGSAKCSRTVIYMYDDDATCTSYAVLRSTNPIGHTIAEVRLAPTPRTIVFAKLMGLSMLKESSRRVGCRIGLFLFLTMLKASSRRVGCSICVFVFLTPERRWVAKCGWGVPPVVSLWFASGSANPLATAFAL